MMAEQIAGLVAQVQAISSQQQAFQLAMEQAAPKTPTAPRAAGPTDGLFLDLEDTEAAGTGLVLWHLGHVVDAMTPSSPGVAGPFDLLARAKCDGWQLESCFHHIPHGRTTNTGFPRSHGSTSDARQTIRTAHPEPVVSNRTFLHQRIGSAQQQEVGDGGEAKSKGPKGRRRCTIAKTEAQISQKPQGGSGCRMSTPAKSSGIHGGEVKSDVAGSASSPTMHEPKKAWGRSTMTHSMWCSMLTSQVLRTRCPFSTFVASSLKIPRSSSASSLPMFPIPVPPGDHFDRMPPDLPWRLKKRRHYDRVVHLMVLALNYLHSDGHFIDAGLLGRPPAAFHIKVYRQLRRFVRADANLDEFEIVGGGRRFPQLVARLSELCGAVVDFGLSGSPYSRAFQGREVKVDNTVAPELEPYRSLDADRLKVTGTGSWDLVDFLDDFLIMACKEPDSLLVPDPREPKPGEVPVLSDSQEEVARLAAVWDKQGLLHVHEIKIFNCYKNVNCDRQIGDRRGRNLQEAAVCGPSTQLPSGCDFLDLFVCPKTQRLSLHCSDRKDYYHQLRVSTSGTISNTVGPEVDVSLVSKTIAYAEFLQRKKVRYNRLQHGDLLGQSCPLGRWRWLLGQCFREITEE